ncbi:MAG TPA: histidine kinase [Gemmatimonadales bacterium]|jgi:two-component system LytT family sensor kinase
MSSPPAREPRPGHVAVFPVFVAATLLGLIGAGQHNYVMRANGGDTTLLHALGMGMPYWYLWALVVPVVAEALRRLPLRRERWLRPASVHLAIALGVALLHSLFEMGIQHGLGLRHSSWAGFTELSIGHALYQLPYDLLAYGAILGVLMAVESSRRARREQLATAALGTQLAEARWHALRAQLNPHFLFNAMNSIAMLVRKGQNDTAVSMIAGLSALLRDFLAENPPQEVPLREELAFVERYLAVEQLRFQDRLRVRIEADPRALDAYVPNLVLQPLVENALKHGIARRAAAGDLAILASATPATLTLTVTDDGPGPNGSGNGRDAAAGVGLRNIRARLEHLYGPGERLRLEARPAGGALATITLPYRALPS